MDSGQKLAGMTESHLSKCLFLIRLPHIGIGILIEFHVYR